MAAAAGSIRRRGWLCANLSFPPPLQGKGSVERRQAESGTGVGERREGRKGEEPRCCLSSARAQRLEDGCLWSGTPGRARARGGMGRLSQGVARALLQRSRFPVLGTSDRAAARPLTSVPLLRPWRHLFSRVHRVALRDGSLQCRATFSFSRFGGPVVLATRSPPPPRIPSGAASSAAFTAPVHAACNFYFAAAAVVCFGFCFSKVIQPALH